MKPHRKPKASALDVAHYILRKEGVMSAMKLQKLVYYCQAWSIVFDGQPMFREPIEAWVHGPVVPQLYQKHKRRFEVRSDDIPGDSKVLDKDAKATIQGVLKVFGNMSPFDLRLLTHNEPPWKKARKGLSPNQLGSSEISQKDMETYYSSLRK